MEQDRDLQTLLDYLAPQDDFDCAEVLVLLGSALPCAAEFAAQLIRRRQFWHVVVSGGVGHSTQLLKDALQADPRYAQMEMQGRSEAELFAQIVRRFPGMPNLMLETQSTNCGDNAVKTRALLDKMGVHPRTIALIQDPTMQRRSMESFRMVYPEAKIYCAPPFHPTPDSASLYGSSERFLSLALGEVPRLRDDENGYGPRGRGYIPHVDIPPQVEQAQRRLEEIYPQFVGR